MTGNASLREIQCLLDEWDPIGVFAHDDLDATDEYASYAPTVLAALRRDEGPAELARLLGRFQSEDMKLLETPERNHLFALRLLEWWRSRDRGPRPKE